MSSQRTRRILLRLKNRLEIKGLTQSERSSGEDARAAVPDEQMSPAPSRYPVDRYLVESSKKIEMVNIIDDDIWNPEPALRPEDEILLRKLHNMLQSTAADLKLLSGELTRHHEPRVQVKAQPTPFDEEFNEKVHIEEVVNAKFYGHKIIDLPISPESKPNNDINKSLGSKLNRTKAVNAGVQVNPVPVFKKTTKKNMQISKTKVVHIKEGKANSKEIKLNNGEIRKDTAKIHYNEISYKYEEPNVVMTPKKRLQVQKMPEVNIRSELREQKVLQLDIMPDIKDELINSKRNINIGVIAIQHETPVVPLRELSKPTSQYPKVSFQSNKQPVRKISKMSTCDSSESTNNVSSDAQHKIDMHKEYKLAFKSFPKSSVRVESKNKRAQDKNKKVQLKRPNSSLDEWKKKLNAVYGQPSSSRVRVSNEINKSLGSKKSNLHSPPKPNLKPLNNAEYIPYTQLTLGGVKVSEIEKEISDVPNKNDIPLSPILDKILSSRENSFHKDSPRARKQNNSPKLLTTSDENLLQEVLDIEKTVTKSLAKNMKSTSNTKSDKNIIEEDINDSGKDNSYADDFEDEKSEHLAASERPEGKKTPTGSIQSVEDDETTYNTENVIGSDEEKNNPNASEPNLQNTTYTKTLNLSFKNSVDVFEFIHSIDTQETGTQSNSISKISLKETQTSPRNERVNIQPIHNDLWPSIDPKGEIENLFQLEKDFIKKLILDEYGDILEKNITKPSTSKDQENRRNNVVASQKNTQTSPAHVRSVMTSPTRTKTRTTSPLSLALKIDRQTSPMAKEMQEEEFKIENEIEDLGASINLSSPRFSLRLPRNPREVLSNVGDQSRSHSKTGQKDINQGLNNLRKNTVSSSSSVDADNSSDISSLGEVKMKLRRRLKKNRISALSESSSSSMLSRYSAGLVSREILPLKSEGEVSLGQVVKKSNRQKHSESDGEMDL